MMFFKSMLTLQKRFCLIDSPIPFQLVCNPMGTYNLKDENGDFIGDRTDIDGTDICSRPAGAWLFDTWKLLPEKYMKENPAFKMAICYDASLLSEGQNVNVSYSDVNLGEGVAGVNGQDVQDIKTHELLDGIDGRVDVIDTNVSSIESALARVEENTFDIISNLTNGVIYANSIFSIINENRGKSYPFIFLNKSSIAQDPIRKNGIFIGEYSDGSIFLSGVFSVFSDSNGTDITPLYVKGDGDIRKLYFHFVTSGSPQGYVITIYRFSGSTSVVADTATIKGFLTEIVS